MAEPVLGKDAVIMFQKEDEYFAYACATDIEIAFEMEVKSVKTIGDGNWDKPRGQKKGYTIELNGLVKFDDDTVPHAFDLYDFFDGMTPIPYRIIFTNDEGGLKVIEGLALPVSLRLGGGSEGHATGSATLKGDGSVDVRDLIIPCPSSITSVQFIQDGTHSTIRITGHTGSPARYDYSVDGGGFVSQFVNSFIQDLPLQDGLSVGSHTITIIPVCQNGYNGTEFNTTFEVLSTGGGCSAPSGLVFSSITETTATASWTPPGSPPADGYYWELYNGVVFIQSGTTASTSVGLTGLTGGVTYTFKVKSRCETGVSESGFINNTFTTSPPTNPTQIDWTYSEDGGTGFLGIEVNGSPEVSESSNNSGNLVIAGGDAIVVDVTGLSGNIKSLYVQDLTTSIVLYTDSGTSNQHFEFTAVANHIYEIVANVNSV